jgi:ferredoxin
MTILYFTGTGNSLHVARSIGGRLLSIPQMIKENKHRFEDDVIGFVYPCHGWGVAKMVRDFIRSSTFRAGYFFTIMTYGNTPNSGLKSMEQAAGEAGIHFDYVNEILMVDNYLPNFEMEEESRKEALKDMEKQLAVIISDIMSRRINRIEKGRESDEISMQGRKMADDLGPVFAHRSFYTDNTCNSCKTCEKVCPAGNITVKEKPEFADKCEMCFACIHLCPQKAIHLPDEKSSARFLNPNIRLREIIESNNRCNTLKAYDKTI